MNAKELLRRYQGGERDFSGEDLRGQSFKDVDLSGAKFIRADIRGVDFSFSNLIGVNFSHTECGLQRGGMGCLVLLLWILAFGFSIFVGSIGPFLKYNFDTHTHGNAFLVWSSLIALVLFFAVTFHRGLKSGLAFFAVMLPIAYSFILAITYFNIATLSSVLEMSLMWTTTMFFMVASIFGLSITLSVAYAIRNIYAYSVAVLISSISPVSIAILVAISSADLSVVFSSFFAAISSTLFSVYISRSSFSEKSNDSLAHDIAIAIPTFFSSTKFIGADLTDANFCSANLQNTDFRGSQLCRTSFFDSKQLVRTRPGDTYLKSSKIRSLVTTCQGQWGIFNSLNLRGVNLKGAKLADASFRSADLSEANLQGADLSRASLVQTQLDHTNLTGAELTAACIEDWGITGDTQLQGVRCEYVFMCSGPPGNSHQECHQACDGTDDKFKGGEFEDFIKPIVDTLDLYHTQNFDPRAIAIAYKKLAESHPNEVMQIVAMEAKGKSFLLRVKVSEEADKSKLSKLHFEEYNWATALSEHEKKLFLLDERVREVETSLYTLQPKIYINQYQHQGDLMSEKPIVNIRAGRDISGVINLGEIESDVNNHIQQIPESPDPDKPDLKKLLHQLQTVIAEEETLHEKVKADALEQVKNLAEAGKAPEEGKMQQPLFGLG